MWFHHRAKTTLENLALGAHFQFPDRAVSLIDGAVGICVSVGVSVGDGDTTEGLPRRNTGLLAALKPESVPERVVLIGIAMWPAVDGDGSDVICGIEATAPDAARELLAD